jgi:TPR repeat protein
MFERGRGIGQDHIEAHKWFNIAEVNGNRQAGDARRLVETLMTPAQIDEAQKRAGAWLKVPAARAP